LDNITLFLAITFGIATDQPSPKCGAWKEALNLARPFPSPIWYGQAIKLTLQPSPPGTSLGRLPAQSKTGKARGGNFARWKSAGKAFRGFKFGYKYMEFGVRILLSS
jgi:hypothetical protein